MPTDRLITINLQELGDYNAAGIYIDGADMLMRRWATLIDTSIDRALTLGQGGSRAEETALYRVRYFKALAGADVRVTFLTEDDGDRYRVTRITEVTGRDGRVRRKWLELDCIRSDVGSAATPTPAAPVTDTTTDVPLDMIPDMIPDMIIDMGGLLAAPTFTVLGTVTEGGIADDEVDFTNHAAINTAWNSGDYWAVLVELLYVVQDPIVGQATALIPIRRQIEVGQSLRAHFVTNIQNPKHDLGYLQLSSGTAKLKFDDLSIPASCIVNLYGVS